jgi:hypothetical protein
LNPASHPDHRDLDLLIGAARRLGQTCLSIGPVRSPMFAALMVAAGPWGVERPRDAE